jgi:hypothetical protein
VYVVDSGFSKQKCYNPVHSICSFAVFRSGHLDIALLLFVLFHKFSLCNPEI